MENKYQSITINGVEYYTKKQVAQMTGLSVSSVNGRIRNGLNLNSLKLSNGRCLLQKNVVEEAIKTGKLVKGLAMSL